MSAPFFADLSWNPVIPISDAVGLVLLFIGAIAFLLWLQRRDMRTSLWGALALFRTAGAVGVGLLWLNPGQWLTESDSRVRQWALLLDSSASMQAPHDAKTTRWTTGNEVLQRLRKAAGEDRTIPKTFDVRVHHSMPLNTPPDGAGSDLTSAIGGVLDQHASEIVGMVVISDGRQTGHPTLEKAAQRARASAVPIHTVALGADAGSRDLQLTVIPRRISSFPGQPVRITAQVRNRGLGAINPEIKVTAPDGKIVGAKRVPLKDGGAGSVIFELSEVPETGGDFQVKVDVWEGEEVRGNNEGVAHVEMLKAKTQVLLLEGAPHWDSKFLAQLLRQQNSVEVLTVHRLNEQRYFRVEPHGAEPLASPDSVFPDSREALARYDLIVFGKGAEGFLTSARASALQRFVREQGGAVLFARGKAYRGESPLIAPLDPVEWGGELDGEAKFVPLPDAGAGLFGAALPLPEDRSWSLLPPLQGAYRVARLKPFARVLAEGRVEGRQERVPMLVARRYGRGMVALMNADGLWRWDFNPQVREQGALYQHFWVQLMQWCGTFSEFRPGEDYALRLRSDRAEPDQAVRVVVSYRGVEKAPAPFLSALGAPDGAPREFALSPLPGENDLGQEWAGVITFPEPGTYRVRVGDRSRPGVFQGEVTFAVVPPPVETDDLRADHQALRTVAHESGGEMFYPKDLDALIAKLQAPPLASALAKPRWESLWPRWWWALLISTCLGAEWWLRRREGLL